VLATQRQTLIMQEVTQRGAARISELADVLQVSEMTIRRDIDALVEQGLVDKVHGGATPASGTSTATEPPFKAKNLREQLSKDAIGTLAAQLVSAGDSIALMGGSTVFAMARHLVNIPRLTVLTNSLPVSDFFHREGRVDQTVITAGGLRTPTDSFVGELALKVFNSLNIDIVFMGTHGMDPIGGFSSPNLLEAETNRAIRERAKSVVVLADHTKWGEVGFATFGAIEDADVLVTDDGLAKEHRDYLKARIDRVLVAETPLV
jgi:DeoR/GlpR family transcriptional regulator of sugar metabolism